MVKHAHLPLCGSLQPSLTPAVKCRYIHLVRTGWVLQRKDRGFGSKEWNHRVSQLEDPPPTPGSRAGLLRPVFHILAAALFPLANSWVELHLEL